MVDIISCEECGLCIKDCNYERHKKKHEKEKKLREAKIKCELCGEEKVPDYNSKRFCSKKCSRSFSTSLNRQEINAKVSKTLRQDIPGRNENFLYEKVCSLCGSSFLSKKQKTRFCSKPCSSTFINSLESVKEKQRDAAVKRNIDGNFFQSFGKRVTYKDDRFEIKCDSILEYFFIVYALETYEIESIKRCKEKIRLENNKIFNPDFDVVLKDGTKIIVECKSENTGKIGENRRWEKYKEESIIKKNALEKYCSNLGIQNLWFTQFYNFKLYRRILKQFRK
jgi:hypothetical protein